MTMFIFISLIILFDLDLTDDPNKINSDHVTLHFFFVMPILRLFSKKNLYALLLY